MTRVKRFATETEKHKLASSINKLAVTSVYLLVYVYVNDILVVLSNTVEVITHSSLTDFATTLFFS